MCFVRHGEMDVPRRARQCEHSPKLQSRNPEHGTNIKCGFGWFQLQDRHSGSLYMYSAGTPS
jgi:hypothetical protein